MSKEPSSTSLPSNIPSDHPSDLPSESPEPSPSPTIVPSNSPSLSQQPSSSPSVSQLPSLSINPSDNPTSLPSDAPSRVPSVAPSSNRPSASPSPPPTQMPTSVPSLYPTSLPSALPSVPPLSPSDIKMEIDGLPQLDASQQFIWETITSNHILDYWINIRRKAGVIIKNVTTDFIGQSENRRRTEEQHNLITIQQLPTQKYENSLLAAQPVDITFIQYTQQISFGYEVKNSRVEGNESVLFMEPFLDARGAYNTLLEDAFSPKKEVRVKSIKITFQVSNAPSNDLGSPTQPSQPPTTKLPASTRRSMSNSIIAIVIVVVLLILLGAFVGAFYRTRRRHQRKEEARQWSVGGSGEHIHHGQIPTVQQNIQDNLAVEDSAVPRQIVSTSTIMTTNPFPTMLSSENNHSNVHSHYNQSTDTTANSTSDPYNEDNEALSTTQNANNESTYSYPAENLLGDGAESFDRYEDMEDLDGIMATHTEVIAHHVPSFSTKSDEDPPSLSGFNITVTDIDEDNFNMSS
eukprot:CAMPEP_0194143132 /NCGR_PEP_ID=MMETSP0152-20130528/12325_1 /TAXON_ID=1049557 /ORGANISM="Thalassiothrix antarctica, Strain L6-D1" /LENGTH=518 /DNA_ID=CAMNT_0038842397 /DNA_START=778 /DNA_END=2334 /DNA_ORIENTATION=-